MFIHVHLHLIFFLNNIIYNISFVLSSKRGVNRFAFNILEKSGCPDDRVSPLCEACTFHASYRLHESTPSKGNETRVHIAMHSAMVTMCCLLFSMVKKLISFRKIIRASFSINLPFCFFFFLVYITLSVLSIQLYTIKL